MLVYILAIVKIVDFLFRHGRIQIGIGDVTSLGQFIKENRMNALVELQLYIIMVLGMDDKLQHILI